MAQATVAMDEAVVEVMVENEDVVEITALLIDNRETEQDLNLVDLLVKVACIVMCKKPTAFLFPV